MEEEKRRSSTGVAWAGISTWFYFLLAFSHCMAGILRGAGKSTVPMFVMMICWCIIRVSYISIMVRFIPDIKVIFWAYPLTWALSSAVFLILFPEVGLDPRAGKDPVILYPAKMTTFWVNMTMFLFPVYVIMQYIQNLNMV